MDYYYFVVVYYYYLNFEYLTKYYSNHYLNLFARHSIDYMLSAPGVRANLEINNV